MMNHSYLRKNMGYFGSRVEAEELLPHSHGFTELNYC